MHRPVEVTHSSFIEGLHMTKNTASELVFVYTSYFRDQFYIRLVRFGGHFQAHHLLNAKSDLYVNET
jgi:hypothetical protein